MSLAFNKRTLKAYPWLSFFSLMVFISLIGLGSWQVYRLQWKLDLLKQIEEKSKQPPANIPRNEETLKNMQFRKVISFGRYLNKYEMHLVGRYSQGKMGYHIITPFVLSNGKVILVNRGWIPVDKKQASKRAESIIKGNTVIEGVLVEPYKNFWFTPKNNPKDNLWFSFPISEVQNYTGLKLLPMIIQETGGQKLPLPIKVPEKIELRNDHLQYAIIWYSLAIALIVIYALFTAEPTKKRK